MSVTTLSTKRDSSTQSTCCEMWPCGRSTHPTCSCQTSTSCRCMVSMSTSGEVINGNQREKVLVVSVPDTFMFDFISYNMFYELLYMHTCNIHSVILSNSLCVCVVVGSRLSSWTCPTPRKLWWFQHLRRCDIVCLTQSPRLSCSLSWTWEHSSPSGDPRLSYCSQHCFRILRVFIKENTTESLFISKSE